MSGTCSHVASGNWWATGLLYLPAPDLACSKRAQDRSWTCVMVAFCQPKVGKKTCSSAKQDCWLQVTCICLFVFLLSLLIYISLIIHYTNGCYFFKAAFANRLLRKVKFQSILNNYEENNYYSGVWSALNYNCTPKSKQIGIELWTLYANVTFSYIQVL